MQSFLNFESLYSIMGEEKNTFFGWAASFWAEAHAVARITLDGWSQSPRYNGKS